QIHALTGDLGEAQDIVQEAYVRTWQRWRKIQAYDRPEAWVRTVACRLAVSRWRRARRLTAALHRSGPHAPVAPGPGPDHVALVAALQELPSAQRIAIVLHYIGDVPIEEVAQQLGCTTGTVKSRLSRGRASLARLLNVAAPVETVDATAPAVGSHPTPE